MTALDEWRWTDEQGVQRVVRTDELRSALSSNVLPPSTLVWREGMEAWIPASQVPELAGSESGQVADPMTDGATDAGGPPAMEAPSGGAGAAPDRIIPKRMEKGSIADTGRPTPTELLAGSPGHTEKDSGAPRPAAGRSTAGPLKIGSAPKPIAPSLPRPVGGRIESGTASKIGIGRGGGWRAKPDIGKPKNDDELTLVADTSAPFKVKTQTDSTSKSGDAKDGRKGSSLGGSKVLTRTGLTQNLEDKPRPLAGKPASVPPAPRPASVPPAPRATVPPAPLVGRKSGSVPPAVGVPRPASSVPPAPRPSGTNRPGASGSSALASPRIPKLIKPSFAIVEHTSTDSTGVLPLSGQYAAEPKDDGGPAGPSFAAAAAGRTLKSREDASADAGSSEPVLAGAAASSEPIAAPEPPPAEKTHHPALASYPPVPQPLYGSPPVEGEAHPRPHDGSSDQKNPPARQQHTFRMQSVPPGGSAQAQYGAAASPYSAPPPPLALAQESGGAGGGASQGGEVRNTAHAQSTTEKMQRPEGVAAGHTTQLPSLVADPAEPVGPETKIGEPVVVPLSSLFGAGGILIAMAVMAFFIGRCSVGPAQGTAVPARASLGALPRLAKVGLPRPLLPCWMAKQPARWAEDVLQRVPVDVMATPTGVVAAYARSAHEPAKVEVEFATGTFSEKVEEKVEGTLTRVLASKDGSKVFVTTGEDSGPLAPYIYAPGASPFVIGMAGRGTDSPSVALAPAPDGSPVTLWSVQASKDDKGLEAARAIPVGANRHAVVFRRDGKILGGFISGGNKAEGELGTVEGSGGRIGKPNLGENGREIAIVFADKPQSDAPWEIRIGHAPLGKVPGESAVFSLPQGGPGGDAFSADIAGLPDGRWVMVWTEGRSGAYAVRAQTLSADLSPLGDPIAVSPPAGNYGQPVIGAAGNYAPTMFLSRAPSGSYELWGAVLQCSM